MTGRKYRINGSAVVGQWVDCADGLHDEVDLINAQIGVGSHWVEVSK